MNVIVINLQYKLSVSVPDQTLSTFVLIGQIHQR